MEGLVRIRRNLSTNYQSPSKGSALFCICIGIRSFCLFQCERMPAFHWSAAQKSADSTTALRGDRPNAMVRVATAEGVRV